jgi:hypothetical protein
LYFAPKKEDATYKQQHDVIFKLEHLQLHELSVILDDTTLICQIREDLKKKPYYWHPRPIKESSSSPLFV